MYLRTKSEFVPLHSINLYVFFLFGIDRRITYAIGKYRFVWMCTGVTRGFARVNLSGSLKMYGSFRVNIVSIRMVIENLKMSFTVK